VDDALLGADPAELAVIDEVAPGLAPVGDERGKGASLDAVGDVVDGCADDVIATTDCKGLLEL
jgi:hypothetical protein